MIIMIKNTSEIISQSFEQSPSLLFQFIGVLVFVSLCRTLHMLSVAFSQNYLLQQTIFSLRNKLLETNYKNYKLLDTSRYYSAVDKFDNYYRDLLQPCFVLVSTLPLISIYLYSSIELSSNIIILILALILYFSFYFILLQKIFDKVFAKIAVTKRQRIAQFTALINGTFDILSQGLVRKFERKSNEIERKFLVNRTLGPLYSQLPRQWLELTVVLLLALLNYLGGNLDDLLLNLLPLAYIAYRVIPLLTQLYVACTQIKSGIHSASEINEVLHSLTVEPVQKDYDVVIENYLKIRCTLLNNRVVEADFNFDQSNTLALIAPSGAGKSTMMHSLAGYYPATVQNSDYEIVSEYQLRSHTYLVTQNHFIDEQLAKSVLSTSPNYLLEKFRLGPGSLNPENIGFNGERLSGGQKNRLAILLSIKCEKALVVLDETFTGIDWDTCLEILSCIKLQTQKRFIVVTHDEKLIEQISHQVKLLD